MAQGYYIGAEFVRHAEEAEDAEKSGNAESAVGRRDDMDDLPRCGAVAPPAFRPAEWVNQESETQARVPFLWLVFLISWLAHPREARARPTSAIG
jgi:hypothetical protein